MKKYIYKIVSLCMFAAISASCSGDDTLTTLAPVNFDVAPVATPNTVIITPENRYNAVTTISWDNVTFPIDAPVTYNIQFTIPADTIGTAAWSNAVTWAVGEDVLSKTLQGAELNTMALNFGLPQDVAGTLVIRIMATMDRTIYSPATTLTVTPLVQEITDTVLYMPGQYQNWDPATAATLTAVDAGIFEGLITFPENALEFKFTTNPNWDEFYGPNGSGGLAYMADGNLMAPQAGTYKITVDLNALSYTLTPYSFGIIGTATPGGWDSDTDMSWDYQNQEWVWTGNLNAGALKFRLNNEWTVNYGADTNGNIVYLDNQGAHNVAAPGNYTVTFSLEEYPDNPSDFPLEAYYNVTPN